MKRTFTIVAPLFGLLGACGYEETALNHFDFEGTVRIPVEAASVEYFDDDNNSWVVENDPRNLGPVYIGVFPSVVDNLYDFVHPEIGPVLGEDQPGNAYPLGGNTIGRFEYGCYQQLNCRIVTGRYTDYGDVLDFFANELQEPIIGADGEEVGSGTEYQERCFELRYATDDTEVDFIEDGELDFALSSDGQWYEAEAVVPHVEYFENMAVWGWLDAPSTSFNFASCDPNLGEQIYYYTEQYDAGANHTDLLNFPGLYIDDGDWVENSGYNLTSSEDTFTLELGFNYDG